MPVALDTENAMPSSTVIPQTSPNIFPMDSWLRLNPRIVASKSIVAKYEGRSPSKRTPLIVADLIS
jgi:hypothetical protein